MARTGRSAPWLDVAWAELGIAERPGSDSDPAIVGYYRDAGHGEIADDGVPWCAAFVGACLARAGAVPTGSLMARSYATAGEGLDQPRLGAIAVLSRGADPSAGHVGFLVGWSAQSLILLGGNQGDGVSIAAFDRRRLVALRWPRAAAAGDATGPATVDQPDAAPSDLFAVALAHVLEMEGGFSDDPYDPGGATNRGITIAEWAGWRGERLDEATRPGLVEELKAIPERTVAEIYRRRYWLPSRAAELPPPLALMHFDAAVNHGLGTAARLLQTALGVAVDGEIGPITLAAAGRGDPVGHVRQYADLRRARYRALPTFWRFGRGWLARVDATTAAARRLASPLVQSQTKETSMPTAAETPASPPVSADPTRAADPSAAPAKWWGQSMTIWGALITAASTVLPALAPVIGPALGVNLTADVVRQSAADLVQIAQALAGVAGTVMTIYGRLRATSRLETRSVQIRI